MPFKSEKQRKYLFKNKPNVAKKFAKDSKKKTHKMPDGTYERCQTPWLKNQNMPSLHLVINIEKGLVDIRNR
jgi:hypothetical protein